MITEYDICLQVGLEREEYDEDDEVRSQVDRILGVCESTLRGAVGGSEADGLLDDPRAEQLMLQMAGDAWEQRKTTVERVTQKVWASLSRFSSDLMTQLRCEYGYPAEGGDAP